MAEPHLTFGACQRYKNVRVGYCRSAAGHDYSTQLRWDAELDTYETAVGQGMNPDGLSVDDVRMADVLSQGSGVPYGTPQWDTFVDNHLAERSNATWPQ